MFLLDLRWFGQIGGYSDFWTFGQIVVITAWVEPLYKYLYLKIRKPMSCSSATYLSSVDIDFIQQVA